MSILAAATSPACLTCPTSSAVPGWCCRRLVRVRIGLDTKPLLARGRARQHRKLDMSRLLLYQPGSMPPPALPSKDAAAPTVARTATGLQLLRGYWTVTASTRAGGQFCNGRPRHGASAFGARPRRLALGGHRQGRGDDWRRTLRVRRCWTPTVRSRCAGSGAGARWPGR
jgi:hypothetical protein